MLPEDKPQWLKLLCYYILIRVQDWRSFYTFIFKLGKTSGKFISDGWQKEPKVPKKNILKGNECAYISWKIFSKGQKFTLNVKGFLNFSDYFLLYFKYFQRIWTFQIHINFENLKKIPLNRNNFVRAVVLLLGNALALWKGITKNSK